MAPESDPDEGEQRHTVQDTADWSTHDIADVPPAYATIRAVFNLADDTIIYEDQEGPARTDYIGAQEWYGPDPELDPYNDGADAVATYSVNTPVGTIYIRESDVIEIEQLVERVED